MDSIVVEDLSGEFWEGALISHQQAAKLKGQGVTVLPVVPSIFRRNGIAGYSKRAWGAGWEAPQAPKSIAPITLYTVPDQPVISWSARIMPTPEMLDAMAEGKDKPTGFLRLVTDTAQYQTMGGGLTSHSGYNSAIPIENLGEPDSKGGWVIGGKALLSLQGEGYYGFALYGACRGIRVVWLAITQSEARLQMRFPFLFQRRVGGTPPLPLLGSDTVPTDKNDVRITQENSCIMSAPIKDTQGWPGHRLVVGLNAPALAGPLGVTVYMLEENSGFWYQLPQTVTQLVPGAMVYLDVPGVIDAPQTLAQRLGDNNGPGGHIVALIVTALPGPTPNGTYTVVAGLDLTTN